MNPVEHVLTLVVKDNNELFLHADGAGLDVLIKSLQDLRRSIDEGKCDHDHMLTESWGEGSLTESMGCEAEGHVIHHLKVFGWTDEWAEKHGFKKPKQGHL